MNFNVISIEQNDLIIMNEKSAQHLNLLDLRVTLARFGFHVVDINVEIDNQLVDEQVRISKNVLNSLKIPLTNKVLIKVENKEIVFGPYIGIYLGSGKLNIGWKYERLASFVMDFNRSTQGSMIAFTENDINYGTLMVNAYCYNVDKDIWRKENVPLPSVIHRYGDMNKKVRNKLRALYGNNLFNYDEMDKWAEISALKTNLNTKKFIPDTIICNNEQQFKKFISSYDDVYFKPVKGRKGRGIHRIIKDKNKGYNVTIQSKKSFKDKFFTSIDELSHFLSDKINSGNYILQKTIKLTINNRVIDFRIRFEKDINNNWIQSIFAARVSDSGGVVSNRSAGGEVITPFDALTKYYNFEAGQAQKIEQKLIDAGHKITKAVENAHVNYGKCAVDLGLEADGTIYHIESNVKAPNDLTTRSIEGFEGLDRACILNTSYSKRLSGFKNIENKFIFEPVSDKRLYSDASRNYNIIFGSSSRDENLENTIEKLFSDKNIEIRDKLSRNFHLSFIVNSSELELLDIFKQMRHIDENNYIRTILYSEIKRKRRSSNKVDRLNKEKNNLNKELEKIKNSTSWKVTKPIRFLGSLLKR